MTTLVDHRNYLEVALDDQCPEYLPARDGKMPATIVGRVQISQITGHWLWVTAE